MLVGKLKAGDVVYVVRQRYRGQKGEAVSGVATVTKVTKYGYVCVNNVESPFSKLTGESVHVPNHNQRSNGYGFDVYTTEEDYLATKQHFERLSYLRRELNFYEWDSLSRQAIEQIYQIVVSENQKAV